MMDMILVNSTIKVLTNVNDSIDVYIQSAKVWVKETGIVYEKAFRLLDQNEEYTFKGQTIKTHQGIFELKDNVLSVKSTNQLLLLMNMQLLK